jgi:hypothetical protein
MNRRNGASIAVDAFYDNFTCAALFRKVRIPGSPGYIIDPRSAHTFWADEFSQILAEVKRMMHLVGVLAMVGVVISFFSRGSVNRRIVKEEESLRTLLADWSSIKS